MSYRRRAVYRLTVGDRTFQASGRLADNGVLTARLDDHGFAVALVREGRSLTVLFEAASYELRLHDPLDLGALEAMGQARVTAPMPGRVVRVMIEPPAEVERGAALLVLEAMKMEHTVVAPADGRIAEVCFAEGDQVEEGAELVRFAATEEA